MGTTGRFDHPLYSVRTSFGTVDVQLVTANQMRLTAGYWSPVEERAPLVIHGVRYKFDLHLKREPYGPWAVMLNGTSHARAAVYHALGRADDSSVHGSDAAVTKVEAELLPAVLMWAGQAEDAFAEAGRRCLREQVEKLDGEIGRLREQLAAKQAERGDLAAELGPDVLTQEVLELR